MVDKRTQVSRRKGVNTPLTSHVSGIHVIRAWELNATTHKVASCEKCEGKVNPR
jgi:hypothetical protein